MEEQNRLPGGAFTDAQMWGYDANGKLVSYQFTSNGVAKKTVDGWVNGDFVSHRDDNGATVSVHRRDSRHFDWVIVSADKTYTVSEVCAR